MKRVYKGQEFLCVAAEPYVRRSGLTGHRYRWASSCVQCGRPFTFESTRKYFRWPTRRCATHRSDPWPPPKRAAPGRRKSQPANEAALRWAIAEVIAHRLDRARWYAYAEIVQAMPEADREAVAALGKRARLAAAFSGPCRSTETRFGRLHWFAGGRWRFRLEDFKRLPDGRAADPSIAFPWLN